MGHRDEEAAGGHAAHPIGDLEQFSALLLSVYRAARELPLEEFQDAALNLVKPLLPFDSCRWATGTVSPAGLNFHSAHFHEEPCDCMAEYEEVKAQDTVAFAVLANVNTAVNFHAPTVFRARDRAGIRHFTDRYRHANGLVIATLLPREAVWHAVSLYRADPDRQYSERERQISQCLAPHLMEALGANLLRHAQSLNGDPGGPRRHLAIADRKGVLYHLDAGFAELLRREWPCWDDGRLPEALRVALVEAKGRSYAGRALRITATPEKALLFLRARERLPADDLSAREIEVARCVAQGLSHKHIAARLGIAPATVRNHIAAIHARLQVRNNAELVAQLKMAGL